MGNFRNYTETRDTLLHRAQDRLEQIPKDEPLSQRIYKAGWEKDEWTCPLCGRMIGKNLKGEGPFALARKHAETCTHIPKLDLSKKHPFWNPE